MPRPSNRPRQRELRIDQRVALHQADAIARGGACLRQEWGIAVKELGSWTRAESELKTHERRAEHLDIVR